MKAGYHGQRFEGRLGLSVCLCAGHAGEQVFRGGCDADFGPCAAYARVDISALDLDT
jgi:hypothetical protein